MLLISGAEKVRIREEGGGGGNQVFRSKVFCLTVPKISVGESFTVAIISGIEKVWIRGGGGSITIFRRSFCLYVPKYFIGEHFGVSEKFFYRKFSYIEGGGHQGFVGTFCFTGPKRKALERNPSVFRKFSGIEKNLCTRLGLSRFSVEIFMSDSAENFRKEIIQFLKKTLVSKSFMVEKGGITFFRRKFLVSEHREISWASFQCFRKFGVSNKFYA